jgi:transposase-like protein
MKKYSVEEKAKFIEEWEKSGKSRRAFSRDRGLKEQTFAKWVRKGPENMRRWNNHILPIHIFVFYTTSELR